MSDHFGILCIKGLINPKYIKLWILDHFKTYIYDWELLDITVHEFN